MDRYSAERPCPICGGHDRLPTGQGIRCAGFLSSDGKYARCTREQFAGGLALDEKTVPAAYVHRLAGPCKCGVTHSEAPAPVRRGTRATRVELDWNKPTYVFPCRRADRTLVVEKARWDYDRYGQKLERKQLYWRPPGRETWKDAAGIQADELFQLDLLLKEKKQNGRVVTAYLVESEQNALVFSKQKDVVALSTFYGSAFIPRGFKSETIARMLGPLSGVDVVAVIDRDDDGEKWMRRVRELVRPIAASLRFVQSKTTGKGDDIAEHLEAGFSIEDLIKLSLSFKDEPVDGESPSQEQGPYSATDGALTLTKGTRDGAVVEQKLCNFTALITAEEVRDDGTEQSRVFVVEGSTSKGPLPTLEVPADRFSSLSWIPGGWGTRAVVYAGQAIRDHVRCAIQVLSGEVRRRVVYTHLGWREINGAWVYLHVGGGIGAGQVHDDVNVAPPGALEGYQLPEPPEGAELRDAIRCGLDLLELAPDHISIPALGGLYRSVLGPCDFSIHLAGPTGVFKTELAAILQSHFGPSLDSRHLPGSWSSTGNALEALAFAAKDCLLVIDDFAPHGTATDVARQHREADRVLRAQGNRSGRARMWADGTLRQVKPPRGLILSTGEDVPGGQSLRARTLVLEIGPGEIDATRLTNAQYDAADGRYAASLAGFIRWLAPRRDQAQAELRSSVEEWREHSLSHRRSPEILGHLAGALGLFLSFAIEGGAITSDEARKLEHRIQAALLEAGQAQAEQQRSADPVGRFLQLLTGALVSGDAHVADADTQNEPPNPASWGWQSRTVQKDQTELETWLPQGARVGWVREDDLYLESEAVFAAVQRLAGRQGTSLGVSSRTLWKRMSEQGLLASHDEGRFTVRPVIGSRQQRVIHLLKSRLSEAQPEPQPGSDADRATDGATEEPKTSGEGVLGSDRPDRPLSPPRGGDIPQEVRGDEWGIA